MTDLILPIILGYSLLILTTLFVIDLKTLQLPNKFVIQFLFCGIAFHILTDFHYITPLNMITAATLGAGLLLLIRFIFNRIYKAEALGMGDVKLIGAAGVWLGTDFIFLAISLGAIMGIIHGFLYVVIIRATKGETINFTTLSIPAGPGFIIGIIFIGIIKFHTLPALIG